MDLLHKASQILMKKEKLSGPEFRAILRGEEIDEENVADFNLFDSVLESEKENATTRGVNLEKPSVDIVVDDESIHNITVDAMTEDNTTGEL